MLRIGDLRVDPPLLLAPMAGVTDRTFRLIVRRIGGAGLVATEFVSATAMAGGHAAALDMMSFGDEERPLAIQIYGSDVETMVEAAHIVEELRPDICDINMGCPANKVLKGCAGCALMGDLELAERMIAGVRRVLTMPLTVKFRLGLDPRRLSYLELARMCEAQGVDAVTLHGRTAKQLYTGEADWSHIARLKEAVGIPVIGNGDVREPEDALAMLAETGCDGVMIGRGATKNPWIFKQIEARLSGGRVPEPDLSDRRRLVMDHFQLIARSQAYAQALHKLRKFTGWYTHGLPNGRKLRHQINQLPDVERFMAAVESFFDELEQSDAVRAA